MYASMLNFPGSLFGDFERLRRELDDFFQAGTPSSIRSVAPGTYPAVNIGHTPASVEIYAFAPGIDPAKVEVTLDRGLLTIAGERSVAPQGNGNGNGNPGGNGNAGGNGNGRATVYSRERVGGRFTRTVSLPDDVDPERVSATYKDGVLRVSVARREAAQPKRITIQ
jgi:HSP20 family protein